MRVLVTRLGIQGEHSNGHTTFVNTVELGEGAHERGGASSDGVKWGVGAQVIEGRKADGSIAIARVVAHEQRRGVVLKVVIATGAHASFGIDGDKGAAGELGCLNMRRHTGQYLRHHGIDVGLVVAHIGGDDAVEIVIIGDVDRVQIVSIRIIGQALERRGGLDLLAVDGAGGSGKADGNPGNAASSGGGNPAWLHGGSSRPVTAIVAKGARAQRFNLVSGMGLTME